MRGRRPTVTLGDAKKFAERQGYVWVPNPDPAIPFDAFAYRGNDTIALRVETSRNAPGVYDLHRDFFRNSFEILKKLPLPRTCPAKSGCGTAGAAPSIASGSSGRISLNSR